MSDHYPDPSTPTGTAHGSKTVPIFLKWKLPKSTVKFTIHVGKKIGVSFLLCHMEREMPKDISGKIDDRCYAHIGSVGRIQKLVPIKKTRRTSMGN